MSWNPIREPRGKIKIAGRKTPGICTITRSGWILEWEERAGYGVLGATAVFKSKKLSHFTISFDLYDETDWDDWNAFLPTIRKLPVFGRAFKSFDVQSEILNSIGIRHIVIEQISQPVADSVGMWTAELSVLEFNAPKFAGAQAAEGAEAEPSDPQDALIKERLERNQREAGAEP